MAQREGKHRLTDILFRELLFAELNSGNVKAHTKYIFYEFVVKDYAIHKRRALQLWDRYYAEWSQLHKKQQNAETARFVKKGMAKGLKSKLERMLFYQKEIDVMEQQLTGEVPFTFVVNGKVLNSHRPENSNDANSQLKFVAPVQILNEIRRTIKEYQTEISKVEGDYAPLKTDIKSDGKQIGALATIKTSDGTMIEF